MFRPQIARHIHHNADAVALACHDARAVFHALQPFQHALDAPSCGVRAQVRHKGARIVALIARLHASAPCEKVIS